MNIKEISSAVKAIEYTQEDMSKLAIFGYETADEVHDKDKGNRSSRRDVTIEIGGPSAHIRIAVQTREEHTAIENVITDILKKRLARNVAKLHEAYNKKY